MRAHQVAQMDPVDILRPIADALPAALTVYALAEEAPSGLQVVYANPWASLRASGAGAPRDEGVVQADPALVDAARRVARSGTSERVRARFGGALEEVQLAALGPDRVACLRIDTSEEAAAEARAVQEQLESLTYAISHDLRQPLRGMRGYCSALVEDFGETLDPEARHYVERALAAASRMELLIDGMLQLSRVLRRTVRAAACDLAALAREEARRVGLLHPSRELDVVIPDHLPVYGDPELLRTLLGVLLDNAWTFARDGARGLVEVGAARVDAELHYFVRDDGIGFDLAWADRIFEPFQLLHGRERGGGGVGLALARQIVARHGGRIWVERAAPGGGATFAFTLGGR